MWSQGQQGQQPYGGSYGYNKGGLGGGFNRWGNTGCDYTNMQGFHYVDYTNGWNNEIHDQMLRKNIDQVYQRYDTNYSGQLQGNEFYFAYRDLCLRMGLCPPQSYQDVWNAVMAGDANRNNRVSKMEMFNLFKMIQGISGGMSQGMGMGQGMGTNYNVNVGGW